MAMTLADIRTKYPQYAAVDDAKLADAIYNKHYAGKDRREFDARIGLKPYDNALETMGKAAANAPAQVMQGLSGVGQQLAEGEAGDPNTIIDALGPGFDNSKLTGVDRLNFGNWLRAEIGGDPGKPFTPEQQEQALALAASPEAKNKFEAYVRNPDNRYIGTRPERIAMTDLKGQLERKQLDKSVQKIDAAPGSAEEIAANAVGSVAQMAPGYAASIALRNPLPAVALAQTLTQGQAYAQARDAGVDPGKAAEYAMSSGFAEAVGEALPLGMILKEGGGKLLPKLFKAGVAEATQEAVTQFIQSMLESGTVTPEMTWGDVQKQVISAAATGAVAGTALTGVTAGIDAMGKKPTAESVSAEVLAPAAETIEETPIEDNLALPAPATLLALPSPESFKTPDVPRRQGPAPVQARTVLGEQPTDTRTAPDGTLQVKFGQTGEWHNGTLNSDGTITSPGAEQDQRDYAARVALQKTRQAETAELLQTARETITPLGTFDVDEIGEAAAGKVRQHRIQMGRPVEAPVTIEDMARAKVPQRQIDAVIAQRRPVTSETALTALDIMRAADAKNIIPTDGNFAELALRVTGQRNPTRMTQAQLNALKTTLDSMPAHDKPVTVPLAEQSPFTDDQYGKALDAVRKQGRYTAGAIKEATGLKGTKDVDAIRDALVRRGQLVQRGKSDYRLYDTLGEERQTVPDDLPAGAFKEYTTKRVPVARVRVVKDGKSVGTFGSAAEARGKVSSLRAADGGAKAAISIEPAEEVAWGVMENRYDEQGNLLGSVVVDSHRDETAAAEAMAKLNTPADTGARYTQTVVEPGARLDATPIPRRPPMPTAFTGRLPEITKRLNDQARERKLPLLGVKVKIEPSITTPEGDAIEGFYFRKLISLTAQSLTPQMSTDEIVERLGQVMDHETIHALRAADVLGPETDGWKTIVRYAKKAQRPGSTETYMEWARRNYADVPGYGTNDAIEEEAIAEAFRHWSANRRDVAGKPATVFRQIVDWFKRLVSSLPEDAFKAIESGQLVADALKPPGGEMPRATATRKMEAAAAEISAAQKAMDENLVRVKSREFLRARAQARDDRYGKSGPKTVLGTTPSKAYAVGDVGNTEFVREVADRYRSQNGVQQGRLMTLLPEDIGYLSRIADAQQRLPHAPGDAAVAKSYRALIDETKAMWRALGDIEVTAWTDSGAPYASPAEMLADVEEGRLRMRLSDDMFGPGADNPGHPLNTASGFKTVDGKALTNNDLFRVVHDIYGHGQSGFRDDPRGSYNAYHEHARLLSPEARRALATETLAQRAWQDYGPHLRRRDGTVPRETDVDYLAPRFKEFAEQKAFVLDDEALGADPGWALADAAASVEETPRFMVGWHGTPHKVDKFSSSKIGTGEGAQAYGYGLYFAGKKDVAEHYRQHLSNARTDSTGEVAALARAGMDERLGSIARSFLATSFDGASAYSDFIAYTKAPGSTGLKKAFVDLFSNRAQGNTYKVDIPEDNELLNWNAPLSKQPAAVRQKVNALGLDLDQLAADLFDGKARDLTGEMIYEAVAAEVSPFEDGSGDPRAASAALAAAGIPGHTYVGNDSGTKNYVIYDDSRVQILEENPKFSKFDDNLPGGRLYGNPNRSPGGALSAPGTPSPAFTADRPGNAFFGGELAEHQLQMARTGERGATMIYLAPADYLALTDGAVNPEQEVYDAAVGDGFKFSGLPSLVIDGYAGNVRATASDGAFAAVALDGNAPEGGIPVMLYPKKGDSLGLVTALEAPDGRRVPWPHDGRAENFPEDRLDGEPRYSLNAPFGTRVPSTPPGPMHNIVQQRVDGWVGRAINNIGRNKRSLPVVGSIFDARVKLQDKMLSIKEMIEQIKETGGDITDLNDTYMLEQLYHGKVFDQIQQREQDLQIPLLEALRAAHDGPAKVQPKDFEDYLYARHAPERNAYLRARGAKDPNPSGMSDAEASTILDRFAIDGKLPELETLAGMADAIVANTTQTRVDAGLISPEAAASSPYQYYVPLRGFAEEELDPGNPSENQSRARSGKGFSVGGREDRTVTGRGRKAGDLLGHLFLQNTESVIRAEKNEVALSFMRLLQENSTLGFGEVLKTAPTRRVVGANGMIQEAGDPSYRQAPDIVTAKWKGKEIIARVADPRLARAVKSDYVSTSNDLVNAMVAIGGKLNRYLATVNTSLNPEFLISNLARDMQTAGILSQQYDIKDFGKKIIGNAPKAMAGVREVLRDGTTDSDWAKTFIEMQKAGGTTEFLGIHDLETQRDRILRSITQNGLSTTPRKAMEYIGKVFKFVDDYNKVAENAFRLSAYKAAREAGVSVPQAAFLAKNLTVNFNKGGELKAFANALYLFYNASTQGTAVLMNGLKNKRVQKIVAGVVAAGFLQDVLNRALSGDDDDNGVTDYDDIPDYVLETNFVMMDPLGLLKSIGIKQGYFSIPMPYGFNAFYNTGRNLSAGFSGSPVRNPGKSAVDSLLGFLDAFNPLGGVQSIWNFVAPTFADPFVDLITNKDYAGNDIVPERPSFGLPVPDSQKYWANAGEVPKWVSEHLNRLTGGNEVRKGAVDISPETLQYGFDFVTGAMGKFAQRLGKLGGETIPNAMQGDFEDIAIGDIPFARRVVGSVTSRGNTERYYQVAEEVQTVAEEIKMFQEAGDVEALRRKVAEQPVEVRLIGMFEDAEKALSALRKQMREVRENEQVPDARKRDIVKQIKEQQDLLMARVNKVYFEQKKAGR